MPIEQALPLPLALTPLRIGLGLIFPETIAQLRQELRDQVKQQGAKFTKLESGYAPITPVLPAAYFYECSTCAFYQLDRLVSACEVVEGLIAPYAWCVLWVPAEGDAPFSWLARALTP